MARPCFPFRTENITVATVWDGSTRYGGAASGSSSALTPVVGAYTLYPVGMSFPKLCELLFRVRLWKCQISLDATATNNDSPPVSYNSTCTGILPMIQGTCYTATYSSDPSYCEDGWDKLKEVGGAAYSYYASSIDAYGGGTTSNAFLDDTTNYTAAELNALRTAVFGSPAQNQGVGIAVYGTDLRYCAGLYYPIIIFNHIRSYPLIYFSSEELPESFYGIMAGTGTLTITLPSGNITVPAKAYVELSGELNALTGTLNITVTPVKYWPYKNAAGTALYNETTGVKI